jgi:transposase
VDVATHQQLVALASETGESLQDTVREAADALARRRLGARVAAEFAALGADQEAWARYLRELESTHVPDGIG